MVELVCSISQVHENVLSFQHKRNGTKTERKFYLRKLKNTKLLMALREARTYLFAPLTFVAGGLPQKQAIKGIKKLLGSDEAQGSRSYAELDAAYLDTCRSLGIEPSIHQRRRQYWILEREGGGTAAQRNTMPLVERKSVAKEGRAIIVFTGKTANRILEQGGTSSWRLHKYNAARCTYAVCTRNSHAPDEPWTGGKTTEDHASAFMIGRIAEIAPSDETDGRTLIRFSKYADLAIPGVWKGWRNPVRYVDLADLGIDTTRLKWRDLPPNGRRRQRVNPALRKLPICGEKLHETRARAALPILVRQAWASTTITYSDLALELGMTNPRVLNYVLGCIGTSIKKLSAVWKEKVPPIQCLVVNKTTGLPGRGIGTFLVGGNQKFAKLARKQRREIVQARLQEVYSYPKWKDVLTAFALLPASMDFSSINRKAGKTGGPGGEGSEHLQLKQFVASNPAVIGLRKSVVRTELECCLPSGDALDVSFLLRDDWIGVEVKSLISSEGDIARGLYQCVKYRAVMEAVQRSEGKRQNSRAILVLGGKLPDSLIELKHVLGIEVIENIAPVRSAG